jgi:hypothetical protein
MFPIGLANWEKAKASNQLQECFSQWRCPSVDPAEDDDAMILELPASRSLFCP